MHLAAGLGFALQAWQHGGRRCRRRPGGKNMRPRTRRRSMWGGWCPEYPFTLEAQIKGWQAPKEKLCGILL